MMSEALKIEEMLAAFVRDWKTHGTPVKGYGNLFYGQFIVLMADETRIAILTVDDDPIVHRQAATYDSKPVVQAADFDHYIGTFRDCP